MSYTTRINYMHEGLVNEEKFWKRKNYINYVTMPLSIMTFFISVEMFMVAIILQTISLSIVGTFQTIARLNREEFERNNLPAPESKSWFKRIKEIYTT